MTLWESSMKTRIKLSDIETVLQYATSVALLVVSGTPLNSVYYGLTIVLYLAMTALLYFCGKSRRKSYRIKQAHGVFFLICLISLMATMVINKDPDTGHYLGVIIQLAAAVLYVNVIGYERFQEILYRLVMIICIYSVILTLYCNINKSFCGTLPIIESPAGSSWRSFFNIYFLWGWNEWLRLIRNSACFREPGVWGAIVCTTLFLKIVQLKRKAITRNEMLGLLILLVGVLSTFSTTAILGLGICFLAFLMAQGARKRTIFWFAIIMIAAVWLVISNWDFLFGKFMAGSDSYVSFKERSDGIWSGLNSWINNPFFGVGCTRYLEAVIGTSANSFVDLLGKYGIFFTSLIVIGLLNWIWSLKCKKVVKILHVCLMLVILCTQNMILMPFFLIPCLYGYCKKTTKR